MTMENFVIFVPEAVAYSEFSAYLRTITSDSFFGYSLVAVAALMILLSIFRYIEQKKILIFQSAADVINLIMNDNGAIKYQKLTRIEACLIIPLTFAGLIFVNGLLSTLKSYLMQPVIQPQIDTIDDIYKSQLPIVINGDYISANNVANMLEDISKHGDWIDKVRVVNTDKMDDTMCTFNRTVSLFCLEQHAKIILKYQKQLNVKGYHIPSQTYLYTALTSFNVSADFPFIERLNEILFWLRESGLFEKLTVEDYRELVKIRSKKFGLHVGRISEEVDIERFSIPMFVIYGWLTGIFVLLIEIIWNKLKLSRISQYLVKNRV